MIICRAPKNKRFEAVVNDVRTIADAAESFYFRGEMSDKINRTPASIQRREAREAVDAISRPREEQCHTI